MSETGKAIDRILAAGLVPLLKREGFRKKGRTWWRPVADGAGVHVVNIQGSVSNYDLEGRFTMNAGVHFPVLAARIGIGRVTDTPAEMDCQLRVRPAALRPERGDPWAEFLAGDDASERLAAAWPVEVYDTYAGPWLARFRDLAAVRDELVRTRREWWAAAASLILDEPDEARRLLEIAIGAQGSARDLRVVWGRENGLLP